VIVQVEKLVRRYGALTAVDGISFEVAPGETFGLIGPDGAGKTSTLRTVLGLLEPHGGTVRTCGLDPFRERRRLSHRVGYLSQKFSLYGDLSVDENVAFFASVHGVPRFRARRDELLDELRLAPFRDRLAARLSGGMKQKLALACTLVHTPELLVLDEPTTGVDPVSRRDFWRILARLQREGMTLLLTTPYLDEAERCGRVALMDHGRILSLDTPDALREREAGSVVEVLARPRRAAQELLSARPEVTDLQTFGERLHATLGNTSKPEAAAAAERLADALRQAGIEVEAVRPTLPSLEDIFIARIRAQGTKDEVHP
jgi:ABC-2 type transport system ATP-binding protein